MDFYEADLDPFSDEDFEELVREALEELPDLLQEALRRNVGVVISDDGRRHRAYGLYRGDGVARANVPDQIIIFRDTLRRDRKRVVSVKSGGLVGRRIINTNS